MIRLIAVIFALAVATSAQAMSIPAPLHQPDGMRQSTKLAARVCTTSMVAA